MWDFSDLFLTFDLVLYFWDGSGFYRGEVVATPPVRDYRIEWSFNNYRLLPRRVG